MLRDSGKKTMSRKTAVNAEKPVMLCRLCHTEFTNFKEHVKSLVHLDARETKTTATPPSKHKSPNASNGESAKRIKTEAEEKGTGSNETKDSQDEGGESQDAQATDDSKFDEPSEDQLYSPTTAYLEDESSNISQEQDKEQDSSKDADLNGSLTTKTEDEETPHLLMTARDLKEFSKKTGIKLTDMQLSSMVRTWRCKKCAHIHRAEDESFDDHVESKDHTAAMKRKLSSMKESFKYRTSYKWLMNCLACSFFTNDKDLFISHVQSPHHEKNMTALLGSNREHVLGKRCTCVRGGMTTVEQPATSKGHENTNPTTQGGNRSKNNVKSSTPQENKSTSNTPNNKKAPPAKPPPKTVFPKPFIEKSPANNAPKNAPPSLVKSKPAPLMSLSLPNTISKNPSRWEPVPAANRTPALLPRNQASAPSLTRNQAAPPSLIRNQSSAPPLLRNPLLNPIPPNNQPGLLGEYRPSIAQAKFGLQPDNTFDLLSQAIGAPSVGVGPSRGLGVGRPAYPEGSRDFPGNRRSFEVESFGSPFGCEKYDAAMWAGRNPAQAENLNSLAFGRVEPDPPPSSDFDTLSKLLTQQPGLLPSNVSLDLASNSSIRFKFNPDRGLDRGAMFDSYPASRPDLSRNDFARLDLPRNNLASRNDVSRADLFSRPMFSRR